jgi:hypothetical protein
VILPGNLPVSSVQWSPAVRIIRSVYPPVDLFEDIADPSDWPLLISAEQKTNPRLMESVGTLDLVPPERRVGGPGASYLMAPFTHVSPERKSRFGDGSFGVLYAGDRFNVALFETAYHHGLFMSRTAEKPGWISQFREIVLSVRADLHDLRGDDRKFASALAPTDYSASQVLGAQLRAAGSNGVVYPSLRADGGECVGLFYPDLAAHVVQGRHLDYHWNGWHVDMYRDASKGEVYRMV